MKNCKIEPAKITPLKGSKGGGDPCNGRTPQEEEDSLSSIGFAYVLDVLCEGEIEGFLDSQIESTKLDGVSLSQFRGDSNGNQAIEQGFSYGFASGALLGEKYSSVNLPLEMPSNTQMKHDKPVHVVFNSNTYPDLTKIYVNIRIPSLFLQKSFSEEVVEHGREIGLSWDRCELGDTVRAYVDIKIEVIANGSVISSITDRIEGKSTGGFIKTYTTNINNNLSNYYEWTVKVTRLTKDHKTVGITNDTFLDSVIGQSRIQYKYPHTVLAATRFSAEGFPSLPQRSYDLKLLKIYVPNNYTPASFNSKGEFSSAASYSGIWNGEFSPTKVWTNNPAWIFYDIITNNRYGVGSYVVPEQLDKWTLYKIAQYCDELVDDGKGGLEPRFTCNIVINNQEDAYTVINNFASIFRGITYFMGGVVVPVQDRLKDPVMQFHNSNVIDGEFTYGSTERNQRRTIALVKWNDPLDDFKSKVERIEDYNGISSLGEREMQIAAFGTTSRGQAIRVGKLALLSEQLESSTVKFSTHIEGNYVRPGDIIEIMDDFKNLQKAGGYVNNMPNNNVIELDRAPNINLSDPYILTLSVPKENYEVDPSRTPHVTNSDEQPLIRQSLLESVEINNSNTVASLNSEGRMVLSGNSWSYNDLYTGLFENKVSGQNHGITWTLQQSGTDSSLFTEKYRILGITQNQDNQIELEGLIYKTEKFGVETQNISTTPSFKNVITGNLAPIGDPTNLNIVSGIETVYTPPRGILSGSFSGATGLYLGDHIVSGRVVNDSFIGDWTNLYYNDAIEQGGPITFTSGALPETGIYQFLIFATNITGSPSANSPLSGEFLYTGIVAPENTLQILINPKTDLVGFNYYINSSGFGYDGTTIGLDLTYDVTGQNDPKLNLLSDSEQKMMYYESGSWLLSQDWTPMRTENDPTFPVKSIGSLNQYSTLLTLNSDDVGSISGWYFRTGAFITRTIDIYGQYGPENSGIFINSGINPATGSELFLNSISTNAFQYEVLKDLPDDFDRVRFWIQSGIDTEFSGGFNYYNGTSNLQAGTINHNLNIIGPSFVFHSIRDNFPVNDDEVSKGYLLSGPVMGITGITLDTIPSPILGNSGIYYSGYAQFYFNPDLTDTDSRAAYTSGIEFKVLSGDNSTVLMDWSGYEFTTKTISNIRSELLNGNNWQFPSLNFNYNNKSRDSYLYTRVKEVYNEGASKFGRTTEPVQFKFSNPAPNVPTIVVDSGISYGGLTGYSSGRFNYEQLDTFDPDALLVRFWLFESGSGSLSQISGGSGYYIENVLSINTLDFSGRNYDGPPSKTSEGQPPFTGNYEIWYQLADNFLSGVEDNNISQSPIYTNYLEFS